MHYLLHLICYPNGVPSIGAKTSDNEQKQTIERILKTLDQWTLRISLLELQLMLKQSSGQSELVLLDNISKATMEVFHHQQSGNKSKPTKASRKRQEQERNSIWLVAPLISKLSGSVQGRVLRSAATILESVGQTWTAKPGSKDKQEKRSNQMSLASPQPLLSLVLTCLKGQDDQKEGLLTSLQLSSLSSYRHQKDGSSWLVTKENMKLIVRGHLELVTEENMKLVVRGHLELVTEENMKLVVRGHLELVTEENMKLVVRGHLELVTEENMKLVVRGHLELVTEET
ncbi:putative mediator of RNA polymerase II transcription subunit 12-like protein [Apostichopus japonicus]|uniref:Putative mediator of RNA polymerase II transcription subunit 12-like protein n=1 Tax=Stichopus japonicus TaxID=307972 RepID=A0A2G8JYR1_STIJA|nr:putative mediator of RNA polymerase II transcription subunit 12-like protein [Apostichopus japonicus]